jgi:glycosyltransferase involved in cell wall biosynthesis
VKLLWYGKWENVDGNHAYMKALSALQADRGHRVVVTYFGTGRTNLAERHPGIEYEPLPYLYWTQPWTLSHPSTRRRFREILCRHRPDVVHASLEVSNFDLSLPGICRAEGIPWIATFHVSFANHLDRFSLFSLFNYKLYRRTLGQAAKVVIFSRRHQRYLEAMIGLSPDRIEVIPNGVDSGLYTPGPSTCRKHWDADFVVGYFGRLAPEKNLPALCQAFLDLEDPRACLVLMGRGISEKRLKRKYGSHPRIHFMGYRSEVTDKLDVIRALDAFVLPSSIEGLSLSMLEAMSCGIPPIVTDVGGNAEWADAAGVVVDPRAVRAGVREALRRLREDPGRARSLGDAARRRVEALSWARNCQRLEEIYEGVRRG